MSEATGTVAGNSWAPPDLRPHHCFACGSLNERGLRLTIHVERERAWTELTLDRGFEGWEGIAHGGIVATILDEVMAWSLVGSDLWGVTARMAIEFARPIEIGRAIRAEGTVVGTRRRIVDTAARIVDQASGEVLATATGLYVGAGAARKRELQARYLMKRPAGPPESVDAASGSDGAAGADAV